MTRNDVITELQEYADGFGHAGQIEEANALTHAVRVLESLPPETPDLDVQGGIDIEHLAMRLRLAYADAEPESAPAVHIEFHPWQGLPEERKRKWLVMARTAVQIMRDA